MDKFRLHVLSITFFLSFLLYWAVFLLTITKDHCWSFIQFWFEQSPPHTPFNWFLLLFSLIICWWLVELSLTIFSSKFNLYSISMHCLFLVFSIAVASTLFNLNMTYRVELNQSHISELINYDSTAHFYSIHQYSSTEIYNEDGKIVLIPRFTISEWRNFRDTNTCDQGVDFNSLSKDEWADLNYQYEQLKRQEYQKVGLDYDDPFKYHLKYKNKE